MNILSIYLKNLSYRYYKKRVYKWRINSFFQAIIRKCLQTPLQKYSENVFAYSCVSNHAFREFFFVFPTKTYIFLAVKAPPPLKDMSAKNEVFLDGSPLLPLHNHQNKNHEIHSQHLRYLFWNFGNWQLSILKCIMETKNIQPVSQANHLYKLIYYSKLNCNNI